MTTSSCLMVAPHSFLPVRCLVYEILLLFLCLTGDHLPRNKTFGQWIDKYYGLRAVLDNLVHGLIGFFSWAVVIELDLTALMVGPSWSSDGSSFSTKTLSGGVGAIVDPSNVHLVASCFLSMVLAMIVDIDHFVLARSLRLKDAVSLPSRPPFHCTTIIPVVVCSSLLMSYHLRRRSVCNCASFSLLFITAWLSHHLRDAHRRGLWLWPLGSTPPLPYSVYIASILLLPILVKLYFNNTMTSEIPSEAMTSTV